MTDRPQPRAWFAVTAVALGTFTLVTNELLPIGLLSAMSRDLHVSEGIAGTMITIPGIVAAIAAPTLTVAAGRLDRRLVLLIMSVLFTAADVLGAVAPNFAVMLIARFLLGLGVGGFWAIGASIGGRLVRASGAAKATAIIFSGVSIAGVIGVPAGAFIGGTFGWRTAFLVTAALGLLSFLLQLVLLPKLGVEHAVTWRVLASVLRGRNARLGLIATLLVVIGQFAAYTYVAPFLEQEAGAGAQLVGVLLLVYGIAGIIGNFAIVGALSRRLFGGVAIVIALIVLSAVAMPLLGTWLPAVFVIAAVWGLAYGALPIAMQTWVFTSDETAPEGGSALYISAFQISIAGGSLLGGRIVDAVGIPSSMFAGAILAAAALVALTFFQQKHSAGVEFDQQIPSAMASSERAPLTGGPGQS
jgi:predicted MFS family arabinose efflux permease